MTIIWYVIFLYFDFVCLLLIAKLFISMLLHGFQGAYLVGVDSLGVDVRVLSGAEVKTHRFPFKVQVSVVDFN